MTYTSNAMGGFYYANLFKVAFLSLATELEVSFGPSTTGIIIDKLAFNSNEVYLNYKELIDGTNMISNCSKSSIINLVNDGTLNWKSDLEITG